MKCCIYATKAGCDVRESLKLMLNVHPSDNAKIEVKACLAGQTAIYMLGYIMKDKAKAAYCLLLSNLPIGQPLARLVVLWTAMPILAICFT